MTQDQMMWTTDAEQTSRTSEQMIMYLAHLPSNKWTWYDMFLYVHASFRDTEDQFLMHICVSLL